MNKADLIEVLEGPLGSRKAAADAIELLVDAIIREVAGGGSVGITGFGTFEASARAARTGRNPRTGETVRIAATTIPKFRPGTQFKDVVSDPARLPADGLAGTRAPAQEPTAARASARTATSSPSSVATPAPTVDDAVADVVQKAKKKAAKKAKDDVQAKDDAAAKKAKKSGGKKKK